MEAANATSLEASEARRAVRAIGTSGEERRPRSQHDQAEERVYLTNLCMHENVNS